MSPLGQLSTWCAALAGLGFVLACAGLPTGGPGSGGDTGRLEDAFLGHWLTASGATAYFVSADALVMVDGVGKPDARTVEMTYEVRSAQEAIDLLTIQTSASAGDGLIREIQFHPGRRTLTHTLVAYDIATEWVWVDAAQTPP